MGKTLDRTKKSNIKCEHCKHYVADSTSTYGCPKDKCSNLDSPKYGIVNYWNRCKCFEWKE